MNLLRGIPGRNYDYSSEDQVLTTGNLSFRYDVDGFLAERIQSGATTIYEYATRGELMKATLPDGKIIEYINDPLGRRIAKKVNGTITEKYLWQGLTRLLAIFDSSDNVLMRFAYADSRLPVAMQSGGATYYLAYDQVGSLRLVTDASGNVIKTLDYDSFGNIIQDTNPLFDMPFSFAGGMIDTDTGLIRFGFREYNPEIGRWTAKDPVLFLGRSTDLYGYCLNDPINLIDPYGLVDLNLFSSGDNWHSIANAISSPPGVFTVAAHGISTEIYDQNKNILTPQDLAKLIKNNPHYKPGHTVRLIACNAGYKYYAQQLSYALNAPVIAPNDFVWPIPNGQGYDLVVAPPLDNNHWGKGPDYSKLGDWVTFVHTRGY